MTRLLSCKLSEDLYGKIEAEAGRLGLTITDMTKKIAEFYFARDQRFDVLVSKLDELKSENARTRSVLLRLLDPDEEAVKDGLWEWVEEDVKSYKNGSSTLSKE